MRWRGWFTAWAAIALAGCATTPQNASPPRLDYVDLTDDFAALYDSAPDPARRLGHIQAGFRELFPDFYDPARFSGREGMYARLTEQFLASFPQRRAAIDAVSRRFAAMFHPAIADFERRIGRLPPDKQVYLLNSMGEFDGATRTIAGTNYLLFGADMIAQLHGGEARAFVQHELFHVYHQQRFNGCAALWCDLWEEGLAVYVAAELNPGATDAELLLTIPEPIRPALERHRTEAVCAVLIRLDSEERTDRSALFSSGRLSPNLPPRFGYLIGSWVAADLGRTQSLTQLAELDGPELRTAIEESLRGMAACPAS